jgi:katanin p80 WD40 repeat-containing subunit B1
MHFQLRCVAAVSRSLTGHRSNCLSLAFTVNDTNQLVSGSLDCNVKVWDLRRKEAIITFKGHKKGVMKVAPSPDNKWVCSGSEDGELKVGCRSLSLPKTGSVNIWAEASKRPML